MWTELNKIADAQSGPWVALGEFNFVLRCDERIGSMVRDAEVTPFRDSMECGLVDMKYTGRFYTWNNKQKDEDRVMSKLDRVVVIGEW